jgi:hypothetical protein
VVEFNPQRLNEGSQRHYIRKAQINPVENNGRVKRILVRSGADLRELWQKDVDRAMGVKSSHFSPPRMRVAEAAKRVFLGNATHRVSLRLFFSLVADVDRYPVSIGQAALIQIEELGGSHQIA